MTADIMTAATQLEWTDRVHNGSLFREATVGEYEVELRRESGRLHWRWFVDRIEPTDEAMDPSEERVESVGCGESETHGEAARDSLMALRRHMMASIAGAEDRLASMRALADESFWPGD